RPQPKGHPPWKRTRRVSRPPSGTFATRGRRRRPAPASAAARETAKGGHGARPPPENDEKHQSPQPPEGAGPAHEVADERRRQDDGKDQGCRGQAAVEERGRLVGETRAVAGDKPDVRPDPSEDIFVGTGAGESTITVGCIEPTGDSPFCRSASS